MKNADFSNNNAFVLLEVLIALLILSFVLLSVVALQITAIKRNHDAYFYSLATTQLNNLVERSRLHLLTAEFNDWQKENSTFFSGSFADYQTVGAITQIHFCYAGRTQKECLMAETR